jgi:hypothetical protein
VLPVDGARPIYVHEYLMAFGGNFSLPGCLLAKVKLELPLLRKLLFNVWLHGNKCTYVAVGLITGKSGHLN